MLLGLAALGSVAWADDAAKKDVGKKVEAAAEAIKNYTIAQKDEAIKSAKATLDDLDARIKQMEDRLDKQWNHMDQAARDAARASSHKLRAQRTELAEWYGQLKQSSAAVWEQVQHGFVESYGTLRDSIAKAQKEF
jgi:chromosome segregation ATPase